MFKVGDKVRFKQKDKIYIVEAYDNPTFPYVIYGVELSLIGQYIFNDNDKYVEPVRN